MTPLRRISPVVHAAVAEIALPPPPTSIAKSSAHHKQQRILGSHATMSKKGPHAHTKRTGGKQGKTQCNVTMSYCARPSCLLPPYSSTTRNHPLMNSKSEATESGTWIHIRENDHHPPTAEKRQDSPLVSTLRTCETIPGGPTVHEFIVAGTWFLDGREQGRLARSEWG